jgi:hypothetical protein
MLVCELSYEQRSMGVVKCTHPETITGHRTWKAGLRSSFMQLEGVVKFTYPEALTRLTGGTQVLHLVLMQPWLGL